METLNEALARAAGFPDCGLRLLDRREGETWLAWSQVHRQASEVAAGLHALGLRGGETVGLFYPTGAEFFAAFFGVLLAGCVPVPLYPPVRLGRLDEYRKRTARMLAAAAVDWVLTDRVLRRILGEPIRDAGCRARTLSELPAAGERAQSVRGEDLGLVQFSSGTTVEPKPVALTHRALMAQTMALNSYWPDNDEVVHSGVSWLPLYHDMGLIGCVFTVLERPSVLTLIPPELFVARPAVWLRALSRYRATISPAPNFAYGLCVEKIRDEEIEGIDLSSWRVALCGAETVVPSVLRRFAGRFAERGFAVEALTPVYGLSEAALAVTFSDLDRPFASRVLQRRHHPAAGSGREIVSVGRALPGFEIEVRNEKGRVLGEGEIGRIWVRGPSLMREYLHRPRETAAVLRNGWLDTGDLGFLQRQELYISGRAKDVLIVRGANHAPEELEAIVSDIDGVRSGCVAAVSYLDPDAEQEEVWLFVERSRGRRAAEDAEILDRCRRQVLAEAGITVDRVEVLEPGTLPRTSSGKIRRQETLKRFQEGRLLPPAPVNTSHLLRALGRSTLARLRQRRNESVD